MSNKNKQGGWGNYLTSSLILKQILLLLVSLGLLIFVTQFLLKFYTNHGQKIPLPNFIGKSISEAKDLAAKDDFIMVVSDSIFVVGQKGGIIREQNPKPSSFVKSGRKIYVTITKYGKEQIKVGDLPSLYGNAFEQKKTELQYRNIKCIIKDYKYDPGEPNHILEVYYNNELIISGDVFLKDVLVEIGSTLECIVSKRDGGDVVIPDLRCKNLEEVLFLLQSNKLQVGEIIKKGTGNMDDSWYIVSQSPPYDGFTNVKMGEQITITVAPNKPSDCM